MESLDSCVGGIKNVWTMALAGCRKNPTYSGYSKVIQIVFRDRDEQIVSNEVYTLGPRYAKPGLQAEKNRVHHNYKKNIVMTECLQA